MKTKKKNMKWRSRLTRMFLILTLAVGTISIGLTPDFTIAATTCYRNITADVVALDQPFFWNRLGAVQPQGMIFALRRDVIPISGDTLSQGNVQLRPDKRPRPMVLRMNVGDCLTISFQNLLASSPVDDEQPATRTASIHVIGMQLVGSIASDGSNVGTNASSLVAPGGSKTYTLYAEREGTHLLYSAAATTGGEGDGGSLNAGLFGAINVQPKGAEWYRSQVTQADMALATTGSTPGGQPLISYNAVYPAGHPREGLPILKMLQGYEIVHTDLTAMITGPNAGRFLAGTYKPNPTEPDRDQPFREFTIIYHDEIGAVQAFPIFEDPVFEHTLHGVRDGFAQNYGTAGVGAEILANRFGVGPMQDCTECKYEEFFLSSWAIGDPAMVVDVPANTTDASGNLIVGKKATKALYPDDPSNVYHGYIRDHVKFRIVHAGSKEHHIHHQHTHQWLHTPDSDNSTYLDSQAIGPGSAYTLEMVHNGSGNRNGALGDSIFHCHFYPHFAQGMWSLWRVHDVFEAGTELDVDGRPVPGSRAYPDGEIASGTPIPALVPLPTLAMAPLPAPVQIVDGQVEVLGAGNPGYPFFVPAMAGHRPPHPPLDTVDDGGLPRHIIAGGTFTETHTRLDFSKELINVDAVQIPEEGTPVEQAAMAFHEVRLHPSFKPDGTPADFITNGRPRAAGAPFADPCVDDNGNPAGTPRIYKAAVIQLDVKINKAGWHFPQHRMITLWGDVAPTLAGTRPPEPLFFRANTNDCITYYHTNLVPNVYEQDDFEVRSPTDILGQHIHLVKFDVTASDGSGNGWNYEDGTFSPDEVIERINAINLAGGLNPFGGGIPTGLTPKAHPYFGTAGAQTTVQRWYADEVTNNLGKDRTLRTVFTHDHFGPSTHQQIGLYAGLVIEPQYSTWRDPESGGTLGLGRDDGGPTSWRADILTTNSADSYREFLLELDDHHHAYLAGGGGDALNPVPDPVNAINVAARDEDPVFGVVPAAECPGGVSLPCPQAISADDIGTMVVNYRNEPIPLRLRNPATNIQATGDAGDLSHVFRSNVTRADSSLNTQPASPPALTKGVKPGDPFTPLLRAYEGDKVQVRVLVGANEEGHNFSVHGTKWLFEISDSNSGYRGSQMMGISEHFEFALPPLPRSLLGTTADYLYQAGSSADDLWNGIWGILRAYKGTQAAGSDTLLPLPNNPNGKAPNVNLTSLNGICPKSAPVRSFSITAVTAANALTGGKLIYNPRSVNGGPLNDPTAILYVRTGDLDTTGKLKTGVPIEPLILRANAGDCINVVLYNKLPSVLSDLPGPNTMPMIVDKFNANQVKPSSQVGLHPQLLYYDVTQSNGVNVGLNYVRTASPGRYVTYQWYAGEVNINSTTGNVTGTPIEFGATNLISSDPIKHSNKGAIGGLIIEPQGSTWVEDSTSRAQATVTKSDATTFREFVVIFQNDINLRYSDGTSIPNVANEEDAEDSGHKAINYRTEPFWFRMGFAPDTPLSSADIEPPDPTTLVTRSLDFTNVLTNGQVGGDPVTPVFTAKAGTPVRFRVLHPGGHQRNNVFTVHGHVWEEEPYINGSTQIGSNTLSEWTGAQMGHGPSNHFDVVPEHGAGGAFGVTGDYLYRDQASFQFDGGLWGIFRVTP